MGAMYCFAIWRAAKLCNMQPVQCRTTVVDDCIHMGTQVSCVAYRAMLQVDFETSGQDEVPTDFLGMQIMRDRKAGTLKIFQEKYIAKMAERIGVGLPTSSRAPTPLPHSGAESKGE